MIAPLKKKIIIAIIAVTLIVPIMVYAFFHLSEGQIVIIAILFSIISILLDPIIHSIEKRHEKRQSK